MVVGRVGGVEQGRTADEVAGHGVAVERDVVGVFVLVVAFDPDRENPVAAAGRREAATVYLEL